jgi:hypothetical protein
MSSAMLGFAMRNCLMELQINLARCFALLFQLHAKELTYLPLFHQI